jgi:hypothetical protein
MKNNKIDSKKMKPIGFKKIKLFKSENQEIRFYTIGMFISILVYIILSTSR